MAYRVVQWATGAIGRTCLRHVLDNPDLELVGLLVHSAAKEGLDAGRIARRDDVGVTATRDRQEILDLEADVVLHTPLNGTSPTEHVDDVVALLRSGKNVITTVGMTYPWVGNAAAAVALEDAARAGGATLFGTGINPGWVAERLAVTVTSICTDVRSIFVREVYDCSPVISPGFVWELCGFGRTESDFWAASTGREAFFGELFGELVGYVGHALGVSFDRVEPDHELGLTTVDVPIVVGTIPAGTVGAIRWRWHAYAGEERFFTVQMDWVADTSLPGFESADGWTVEIDGSPRVRLAMAVEDPVGVPDRSKAIQYATAGPVVRAIPDVVAAAPGILIPPVFAAWRPPRSVG